MGKPCTEINLRTTSPEGEVKMFNSFPEAASGLGFSECTVKKAYYSRRDRVGEYQLEWLEVKPKLKQEGAATMRRMAEARVRLDCIYCGCKLTRKERADGFSIMKMDEKTGYPIEDNFIKSLYEAQRLSELSLCSLINAAKKGNVVITRRKDKQKFILGWNPIHEAFFQARREERWKS